MQLVVDLTTAQLNLIKEMFHTITAIKILYINIIFNFRRMKFYNKHQSW